MRKNELSNYYSVHCWLKNNHGKATYCSNDKKHKAKRFEWANITGIYENNIDNFIQLCPSCHRKMDDTPERVEKTRKALKGRIRPEYGRIILQFDLEGNLINEYLAVRYAAKENNMQRSIIHRALNRDNNKSRKHYWFYKTDL